MPKHKMDIRTTIGIEKMNLLKFKKLFNSLKSKFYYDYNASSLTWFRAGEKAEIFCITEE